MLTKSEKYKVDNLIENLEYGKSTCFIDKRLVNYIIPVLNKKKISYKVFKLFSEASNYVIYIDDPEVTLLEIKTKNPIKHSDILGSIFALGFDFDVFGDIVIANDKKYIVVRNNITDAIISNLSQIGKNKVSISKVDIETVKDFTLSFEEININVTSPRFDAVFSKVTNLKRDFVNAKVKNKEILINFEVLTNNSYMLKETDVISIRGVGKFIYDGVISKTKKDKYVIKLRKYN